MGAPPPSVCSHHTGSSRRGRTPHAWFGLLWPDTSMATQVRARMASASGLVGIRTCVGDPRRRFPSTTPGGRVVNAHRMRGLDFSGQKRLWPPKHAHEWPVQAAWLGFGNDRGTQGVCFHAPHPVVASWTHSARVVWTSMARYFYGDPRKRTNRQCKRRGWDTEMLNGPPAAVSTHHTRWALRGCTPYAWFGLPWPDASMATQVRAQMATASGVVGIQKCLGDPGSRPEPTTPVGRVVGAHHMRGLDFSGQIPLWPPKYAHEWPVQAARLGFGNVEETQGVGFHAPHPVVASWTHSVRVVWTSMA